MEREADRQASPAETTPPGGQGIAISRGMAKMKPVEDPAGLPPVFFQEGNHILFRDGYFAPRRLYSRLVG